MALSSESDSPLPLPALNFRRWKRGVPRKEFLIAPNFVRHGPLVDVLFTFVALFPDARLLEEDAAEPIAEAAEPMDSVVVLWEIA